MTTKQPESLIDREALFRDMRELGYTTRGQTDDYIDLFEAHITAQLRTQHALLVQALETLKHHVEQTRPIHRTEETIAAIRAALELK